MNELNYPFSSNNILKKKKALRRILMKNLGDGKERTAIKLAVLGGSTIRDIVDVLELFLLNEGFQLKIYESDYGRYWEEAVFENKKLDDFSPDVVYIHTSMHNISELPEIADSEDEILGKIEKVYVHFLQVWTAVKKKYNCVLIQDNFAYPNYRILGNMDSYDHHGNVWFAARLNQRIHEYAYKEKNFYVNDVNYLSSAYGLLKWNDPYYWYMYKYALAVPAVPELSYNIFRIIKAIYGKNKKVIMTDLDNTIWGGTIAEDGLDEISIGGEGSKGEIFSDIQAYIKKHKDLGIVLTVNSKNDAADAVSGFLRKESVLHKSDFAVIKANWNTKSKNAGEIAAELNLGMDAFVFLDDNPAERDEVKAFSRKMGIPRLSNPEYYIQEIDRAGYFECVGISEEDTNRSKMYKESVKRNRAMTEYGKYDDFLLSLNMRAEIESFAEPYYSRISQLTNKSNQFNLTVKRCTRSEIEQIAEDAGYISLYGRLKDKYGDNGLVSVVFGHIDANDQSLFHIDEWLMSCRVLKRNLEYAMMDALMEACLRRKINMVKGYYYPSAKNHMVKNFYGEMGFLLTEETNRGDRIWEYHLQKDYKRKNKLIRIEK